MLNFNLINTKGFYNFKSDKMKKIVAFAILFSFAAFGRAEKIEVGTFPAIEGQFYWENNSTSTIVDKQRITMSQLPKFTQKFIKENYPVRKVRSIYKVKESGNVTYEVEINLEGMISVVKFDKEGELIDESVKK